MSDRKPPRLLGGERATLLALLDYQRDSFVRKISGITEAQARKQFVTSGTTLYWLVTHTAQAEQTWVITRFLGENPPGDEPVTDRDTVQAAIDRYHSTNRRVDAIVEAASLDDVCQRTDGDTPVNLRWVLFHLLEETARHAGHADILRELVDGTTGR